MTHRCDTCAHWRGGEATEWVCPVGDCKTTWDSELTCWEAAGTGGAPAIPVMNTHLCGNCKASVMPAATHCHMCGKMYGRP